MKAGGTLVVRSRAAEYGVGRSLHRMPPWDTRLRNILPPSQDALVSRYAVTMEEMSEDARVRNILASSQDTLVTRLAVTREEMNELMPYDIQRT